MRAGRTHTAHSYTVTPSSASVCRRCGSTFSVSACCGTHSTPCPNPPHESSTIDSVSVLGVSSRKSDASAYRLLPRHNAQLWATTQKTVAECMAGLIDELRGTSGQV